MRASLWECLINSKDRNIKGVLPIATCSWSGSKEPSYLVVKEYQENNIHNEVILLRHLCLSPSYLVGLRSAWFRSRDRSSHAWKRKCYYHYYLPDRSLNWSPGVYLHRLWILQHMWCQVFRYSRNVFPASRALVWKYWIRGTGPRCYLPTFWVSVPLTFEEEYADFISNASCTGSGLAILTYPGDDNLYAENDAGHKAQYISCHTCTACQ